MTSSLPFSISVETNGSYIKSVFNYPIHLKEYLIRQVLLRDNNKGTTFGKGSVNQPLQTRTVHP